MTISRTIWTVLGRLARGSLQRLRHQCIMYQWEGKFQSGAHVDWPWFTLVSNAYLRAEGWSIKMIIIAVALTTQLKLPNLVLRNHVDD